MQNQKRWNKSGGMGMILVSACLLGMKARYDGTGRFLPCLAAAARAGLCLPVCPEQCGGLATPRCPAEICGGSGADVWQGQAQVKTADGMDVTMPFLKGAQEVERLLAVLPVTAAVLKERSPSCGSTYIYDGSFSGKLRPGEGVTAWLLRSRGIPVYHEQNLTEDIVAAWLQIAGNAR